MGYLGNYRELGQAAAEIQARLPAQLRARCGAAGREARHWPSDSPFRLRPNDAVPSGLYGHPASARRATARRGRKLSALLAALLFAASGAAQAKTITALTPSFFDVNKAIGSAVDGDTVIIPAGKATWTTQLALDKGITLMGQTTTNSAAGTAVDNTIIVYNLSALMPLIRVPSVLGKSYRISGLSFQDSPTRTVTAANGFIGLLGSSQSVRIDHCHYFVMPFQAQCVHVGDGVYGVADHNLIEISRQQAFNLSNGREGTTDPWGNFTFSLPTGFGTGRFFFIEDNYIKNPSTRITPLTDGTTGCRFVVRHNHCYNVHVTNHGTEGGITGGRATELYDNDFHWTFPYEPAGFRGGNLIFYNNTWDGTPLSPQRVPLSVFRATAIVSGQALPPGWQGADGSGPWDFNDTSNGTFTNCRNPGPPNFDISPVTNTGTFTYAPVKGLYDSGTASAGTALSLTDSTKKWATNMWAGFAIKRGSDGQIALIVSNTATVLTLASNAQNYSPPPWAAGNQYKIHRVLVALHQSSRGQGDVITGVNSDYTNTITNSQAWPHQKLEPAYGWNNKYTPNNTSVPIVGGVNICINLFKENRDYYNQAAPVSGVQTVGVGVGTLSNRPASGVNGVDITGVTTNPPGTAYWATDKASVNGSTETGALYVWRGGAWVLYYQPYTYPHPLTRAIAPPSNLQVVP